MPIDYHLDTTGNLVVFQGFGIMTEQDALDVIDKYISESNGAAISNNLILLVDKRALVDQFDAVVFSKMKDKFAAWLKLYPRTDAIKCAVVATEPGQIALAHLWGGVSEAHPAIQSFTKVFSSEAAARAWLGA